MSTLSLCMIVKDEETVLPRCLKSVQGLFDEIVVIDTGSKDHTREIARAFGAFVYDLPWRDDFSATRNFSFSKATSDYLFWMDADDVLPPPSRERFPDLRAFLEEERPDTLFLPYECMGQDNAPSLVFRRERVLRRCPMAHWVGRVHECIVPFGKQSFYPLPVRHLGSEKERGERNLRIYEQWEKEEPLSPRDAFYFGRELYYHRRYEEAAARLEGMLKSDGWYVNKIEACKVLALCYEAQGLPEQALSVLFQSFLFGEPRASVCCELGRLLQSQNRLKEAVFWFEAALSCRDHSEEGDFETPDSRALTPLLSLVCCYDALGEKERALAFHRRTEELFPLNPAVIHNRAYFQQT